MTVIPKLILWACITSLLAFGAKAQDAKHDVKVANTLICGTADDTKRFLQSSENLQRALSTVNDGTNSSKSCLVAPIAYVAGQQFDRVERSEGTFIVTEIMIVGVATPYGMLAIKPSVVYTALPVHEEAA